MKKILVSIALLAAAAFSANAQFRVEAGVRFGDYKFEETTKSEETTLGGKAAPQVRVFADLVNFADGGIELGLGFAQNKVDNNTLNSTMTISNLELPVHVYYGFDLGPACKLCIYAGLYGSYSIGGKTVTGGSIVKDPFNDFSDFGENVSMKRFDLGMDTELVLTINDKFTVGFGAQEGLLNLYKGKSLNIESSAVLATIGWRF